MVSRRRFLVGVGAAGGSVLLPATGPAAPGTGIGAAAAGTTRVPPDARGAREGRTQVLRESGTATYDDTDRRFQFSFAYDVPDSVDELVVTVPSLRTEEVSVVAGERLERTDEVTFTWSGAGDPTLTIDRRVETPLYAGNGYVTDDAAFARTVATDLRWQYRETAPAFTREIAFDGEGHAGSGWTYAGPFAAHRRTTHRASYTVVVPAETGDVDAGAILDLYDAADGRLPTLVAPERASVFVAPSDRLEQTFPAGRTSGTSVLFDARRAGVGGLDNVPAHEYVHLHFGNFAEGPATWLVEGTAEYLGALLSLNAGIGTVGAFLDLVRTERFGEAVLAEVRFADDTRADYRKGAHVCAALDAEIRRRSDGAATLPDALASDTHDVGTLDGFVAAAVAAAGDETLADWIDRYVRTEALPAVPEDQRFYTLGDTDPATLPTATPTPSPTPSPTPTASATPSPFPDPTTADPTTKRADDAVTSPGFGAVVAGGGLALAALVARLRNG